MELAYQFDFDFVQDTQKIFRQLLNAFANPAQTYSIEEQSCKFENEFASLMAIGCTLLDTEVSMYIENSAGLQAELESLTLASATHVRDADYVFIPSEVDSAYVEEKLLTAKKGSYTDPHLSATFIFLCDSLEGDAAFQLSGPGIDGKASVQTTPYIQNILAIRQKIDIEYPCGIDLLFVTKNGQIMGIPRLITIV